jgi:hypothetical protein
MVQPGPSGLDQIYREELGEEQIIVCSSHSTCEAVILQPDARVVFSVVFGDVARCLKASWKAIIAHGASEYLGTRPFETEVASFTIITAPATRVLRASLQLHAVVLRVMPPVCLRFRLGTRSAWTVAGRKAFR